VADAKPVNVVRMEHRALGGTGVKVSAVCLGAMMLGSWGNADHDESVSIIRRAVDAGINFIDTADVYSAGESETIVGKAIAQIGRDDLVVATKVHGTMGRDPNSQGNSRRWILAECENSLRRLGVDYIDLYQIHRPEPDTDIDETLGALSDLVHAGKVRYVGSSTFPAHQIVEAQWVADRRNRERFVTEQPPYSILARGIEADVLPVCHQYRMGVLSWSPLAGGWLSGRFGEGKDNTSRRAERIPSRYEMSIPANRQKLQVVDELTAIAQAAGLSLVDLAIAFVLAHPDVTCPIIGPRTMDQLETLLSSAEKRLGPDVLDRIDELVAPGTNLNAADSGWLPPSLERPELRRR
jgi:aryl-alcohol dehydrogenase-like predicted oxidoreductase